MSFALWSRGLSSSAVLAPPVLALSSKVQQTSGWAERRGSVIGPQGWNAYAIISLFHPLPHPSNTKCVDPQCSYALTAPPPPPPPPPATVPVPVPETLSNLPCMTGNQRSATNSALHLLGQISPYPARAWTRCVITGRSVWSRMMSQCASAPRPARRHPIRCVGPTATATAVPARCEP